MLFFDRFRGGAKLPRAHKQRQRPPASCWLAAIPTVSRHIAACPAAALPCGMFHPSGPAGRKHDCDEKPIKPFPAGPQCSGLFFECERWRQRPNRVCRQLWRQHHPRQLALCAPGLCAGQRHGRQWQQLQPRQQVLPVWRRRHAPEQQRLAQRPQYRQRLLRRGQPGELCRRRARCQKLLVHVQKPGYR